MSSLILMSSCVDIGEGNDAVVCIVGLCALGSLVTREVISRTLAKARNG